MRTLQSLRLRDDWQDLISAAQEPFRTGIENRPPFRPVKSATELQ